MATTCRCIGNDYGDSWMLTISTEIEKYPRDALTLARGDGRHVRLLRTLARVELLVLDDWGLAPMTAEQQRDLRRFGIDLFGICTEQ